MFFESHAHYDNERFDIDRESLLKNLQKNSVEYVINIAADIESAKKSIKLTKEYSYIYSSVGVHPHYVENMQDEDIKVLELLCNEIKVVAIGEIGLDFYYNNSSREKQYKWFLKQLELAKKLNLPVIIHCREADKDVFDMLKEANLSDRNGAGAGVIHCYSGSMEMAKEYIKLGYYIGVGGVLTFKNAKKLVNVVKNIPLERILIETDCPYLSPIPKRGERNDSTNLKYVVETISEIKNIPFEDICNITKKNGLELFLKN